MGAPASSGRAKERVEGGEDPIEAGEALEGKGDPRVDGGEALEGRGEARVEQGEAQVGEGFIVLAEGEEDLDEGEERGRERRSGRAIVLFTPQAASSSARWRMVE